MEYALVGILLLFLVYLFLETRRKAQRVVNAVNHEKRLIADDSGMTATLGVFAPDTQTTVVVGVSEQLGVFYYRMLRQSRVIVKSRINLANLAKIEFVLNGQPFNLDTVSSQLTVSLQATEISDRTLSGFSADSIRQVDKAAMRIVFYDDAGLEKALDITTFRARDERQKFERVQLLKTTVWWVAFLQLSSRNARRARQAMEEAPVAAG